MLGRSPPLSPPAPLTSDPLPISAGQPLSPPSSRVRFSVQLARPPQFTKALTGLILPPANPPVSAKPAKRNELSEMQKRFVAASSNIRSILNDSLAGAAVARNVAAADAITAFGAATAAGGATTATTQADSAILSQKTETSTAITSQLTLWKSDVNRLLTLVQSHIHNCQLLQRHEVTMSHNNTDTPVDTRRKAVNEEVLSLKADARALMFFLGTNALVEDHEVPVGVRRNFLNVHEKGFPKGTKYYWRERMKVLEMALAAIKPIEVFKEGKEGKERKEGAGTADTADTAKTARKGPTGPTQITSQQLTSLWDLRQQLMMESIACFVKIQGDAEADFDAGESSSLENILRLDTDKRNMSGFMRSFLKVAESIEQVLEDSSKLKLPRESFKEGVMEAMKTESYRKQVSAIQYQTHKVEEKIKETTVAKNDYQSLETRRGLLQRWRVKLDELDQGTKVIQSRETDLVDEQQLLDMEEQRLHNQIAAIRDTSENAAAAHEKKLQEMHPKIIAFEEEAVKHKAVLEALLLDVNLTTGLFKKREFEVSAVEKKLEKTRSARAQIEVERRKNEMEYSSLNVDARRNKKILDVALEANEEIVKEYRENRKRSITVFGEIEEMEEKLQTAVKEREHYEGSLRAKEELLAQRKEKHAFLVADGRRVNGMLANIKEQVGDTMAKFDDARMDKLKSMINQLKDQDIRNANLKNAIAKSRAKLERLEQEAGREGKLDHLLVEFG